MENEFLAEGKINERSSVVIRKWNDITPFVVHTYNTERNDFTDGDYCKDFETALKIFNERLKNVSLTKGEK